MTTNMSAAARRDHWVEVFVSEESKDWDYGQWIVALLEDLFDSIETIIGADASAAPLMALLDESMGAEGEHPSTWREALERASPVSWTVWDLTEQIRQLGLYGRYGVTDPDVPLENRADHLEGLLTRAEAFLASSDLDRVAGKANQLTKIVHLARARWNLDTHTGDLDPASLAVLGGLSEGRIRNMMTGPDRTFENVGGRVTASSALSWLQNRPQFFDSIWDKAEADDAGEAEADKTLDDVVFVPIARDRSQFHPGLAREGRYQVGPKVHEVRYDSFEEALAALQRMTHPSWRRPNAAGNWSIVTAAEWGRVERAALMRGANP